MQKNLTKFVVIVAFGYALLQSCSKNDDTNNQDPGTLEIVKNTSFANQSNSLQAVLTSGDNAMKGYYYGTFDANGVPDNLSEIIINKISEDKSVHLLLDEMQRVKSLYLTNSGIKENALFTFDYSIPNKTTVFLYDYNFNNNISNLLYRYTVDNSTQEISNNVNYASIGGGLLTLLLQISPNGGTVPDKFGSQVITSQGSAKGAVVVLSAATGALAAGVAAAAGVTAVVGVGLAAAAIMAAYLIWPTKANASEINSLPPNSPQSPTSQTQNTQLKSTYYFVGAKNTADQISYGGGIYCNYTAQYINTGIDFKINKTNNSIIQSQISVFQKESITDTKQPCSTQPFFPINMHKYVYSNGTYDGNNINITYSRIAGAPSCAASFVGIKSGNKINGTITLNRNDVGTSTVDYTIYIPVSLNLIN